MKKYLVVGKPIKHSLSPLLHNYWIKKNKITAEYEKKELFINDLEKFVNQIKNKNLNGINVTVPFKKDIIPFLDKLSPEAESTQSVNTIYLDKDKVIGHNTDICGFKFAISNINYNFSVQSFLQLVLLHFFHYYQLNVKKFLQNEPSSINKF